MKNTQPYAALRWTVDMKNTHTSRRFKVDSGHEEHTHTHTLRRVKVVSGHEERTPYAALRWTVAMKNTHLTSR